MASSISVNYASTITVVETLGDTDLNASGKTVTHSGNSTSGTINGSSSPPVTQRAALNYTMTTGAVTINLRTLTGTNGGSVDGNGLRVQYVKIINPLSNANSFTISQGASNGYNGFGADFSLTLVPGAEALIKLKDGGGDISDSNKTLDVAGTGSQVVQGEIVLG